MKKSVKNISIIIVVVLSSCYDNTGGENGNIIIREQEKIKSIEIFENDSTKSVIILKDGKIETISKFKKGKLNGEQLKFFSNGNLSKKGGVSNGLSNGYIYEFYPSGSILSFNYYCQIYPCNFGVEYWDGPLNTLKKSIHYGERGNVDKVRLFDSLGYFIKDSFPY
jgi:hypothetical protein